MDSLKGQQQIIETSDEAKTQSHDTDVSDESQQMTKALPKPTTKNSHDVFPFLDLPAEIRNMIYELAIVDYLDSHASKKSLWLNHPFIPITRLDKQTRAEGLALVPRGGELPFCADFTSCAHDKVIHPSIKVWIKRFNVTFRLMKILIDLQPSWSYLSLAISIEDGTGKLLVKNIAVSDMRLGEIRRFANALEQKMEPTRNGGIGLEELEAIRKILVDLGCLYVPKRI